MITVTKQEIGRWEDVPESPMKWSAYPYEEGEKRLPAVVSYGGSYGGGQNSTAMVIGLVLQGRPIDRIQFADTGSKKPETYEYVKLFEEWIQAQGYPGITRVHDVNQDGRRVTLEAASIPFAIRLRSDRRLRLATEGGGEDGPALLSKMYARGLSIGESRIVGPRQLGRRRGGVGAGAGDCAARGHWRDTAQRPLFGSGDFWRRPRTRPCALPAVLEGKNPLCGLEVARP